LGGDGEGIVFRIEPDGVEKIVYVFSGLADGGGPEGGLIKGTAGDLYGTASLGGTNGGGTVFRLDHGIRYAVQR
jgi:uncharacterized repeat protein (TIGR03803 family)